MLSKKTQYAIYALTKLAREYQKGPILIEEIAKSEKLPKKFLEAILIELKNGGYVSSKKGKGGGYYLIKPANEINLADIIRKFDGALGLLPCVTYHYYESCSQCRDEATCGLRSVLKELRDETVRILKGTTLQDIMDRETTLSSLHQL